MLSSLFSGLGSLLTLSASSLGAVGLGLVAALIGLYLYFRPQPLQGIPYNRNAVWKPLGDFGSLMNNPDGPIEWMIGESRKSAGPIRQILSPFGKPMLLISDFHESQDICMRRPEFDRSDGVGNMFSPFVPTFHINMKIGPEWKAHRRLLQDLMAPAFLNDVAGHNLRETATTLIELWKAKTRLADGRPFRAGEDCRFAAFDSVLGFSFGDRFPHRALPPQLHYLQSLDPDKVRAGKSIDDGLSFEHAECHPDVESTLCVTDQICEAMAGTWPAIKWSLKMLIGAKTNQFQTRRAFLKREALRAAEQLEAENELDDENGGVKAAVDLMLKRERILSEKDNRDPQYWSNTMHDEILGFVVAGHDTSATTFAWGVKFLTDSPDTQTKLRDALFVGHPNAYEEKRDPSNEEITRNTVPYLDAVMEEILRCAGTVPGVDRQATKDTTVLGHHVPKGTQLFMLNRGPGFTEPNHHVDMHMRSETSQNAAKEKGIRVWGEHDMGMFRPERWLVEQDGETSFDLTAGPNLPFGMGLRGCFGRRLAYLELRVMLTMVIWNFEMLKCPENLSKYDAVDGLTHHPKDDYLRLKTVW